MFNMKHLKMTPILQLVSLLVLLTVSQTTAKDPYANNKVYDVKIISEAQVRELIKLKHSELFDILSPLRANYTVSIRTTPENENSLESFIGKHDLQYKVNDLPGMRKPGMGRAAGGSPPAQKPLGQMSWDTYYTYEGILAWHEAIAKEHSKSVKWEVIGKSHEGREIKAFTIAHPEGGTPQHATLVDCQIHAREWISSATCNYIINELTTNGKNYDALLRQSKFYIVPFVNPDGFVFTHSNERLWRKNRRPDDKCPGVDLNRNFPHHWSEAGGSQNPCEEDYIGPSACSEPECQTIVEFIKKHKDEIDVYFTLHSYGQLLLTPWSYTKETPEDQADIAKLTKAVCKGLESGGAKYECGASGVLYSPLAGVSDDWAKAIGVKYTFTIELPPGSSADGAFHLPEAKILSTCQAAWKGIQIGASKEKLDGSGSQSKGRAGHAATATAIVAPIRLMLYLILVLSRLM